MRRGSIGNPVSMTGSQHAQTATQEAAKVLDGARIISASVDELCELSFTIETSAGRTLHLFVKADPEGNGPGSLHVLRVQGTVLTILGGR